MEWTVRIIVYTIKDTPIKEAEAQRDVLWLGEVLRLAGITRRLATFDEPPREVFELRCPHRHDRKFNTEAWSRRIAQAAQSFGVNAVAAPAWNPDTDNEGGDLAVEGRAMAPFRKAMIES